MPKQQLKVKPSPQSISGKGAYRGKIHCYGGFSLGYSHNSKRKEKSRSNRYESSCDSQYFKYDDGDGNGDYILPVGECPHDSLSESWEAKHSENLFKLNLTRLSISHKRAKKGLKGISSKGKHTVKSACFLLERKYGRKNLCFGTVTIPPLSEFDSRLLNQSWSEFVRRFNQEIRRELERKGAACCDIVEVTEIQEKRLEKYDFPYLHLHFVCIGKNRAGAFLLHPSKVRSIVRRCVLGVLFAEYDALKIPPSSYLWEVNFSSSVKLQVVKRSAVGYLGKYMSKGGKVILQVAETNPGCLPCQWWYVSSSLKKVCNRLIIHIDDDLGSFIRENIASLCEYGYIVYVKIFDIDLGDGFCVPCFSGNVSSEFYMCNATQLQRDVLGQNCRY